MSVFNYYNQKISYNNRYLYLDDIAKSLKTELQFAQSLEPGYHRSFKLPATIGGQLYSLEIFNSTQINSAENISEMILNYNNPSAHPIYVVSLVYGNVNLKSPLKYGDMNNISLVGKNTIVIN